MRCITSSCLNKVARMRDAQSASTSGATSMMTEDAEVNGDRLCAVRMLLYASAYEGRVPASCGGGRQTITKLNIFYFAFPLNMSRCTRKGCGKDFTSTSTDKCIFHSGEPVS